MPTRDEMWDRLGKPVDVLVVGGGITGAGIARDAAMRGLSVALVEMRDLAFGTSSRSSKLVHGGLRYLEHYEFSLVFEALSERRTLLDIAPHLVHPLGFLFPIYKGSRQPLWMLEAGMWLYDGLSLFRSPKMHQRLSVSDVADVEPMLTTKNLKGAPLYYDCATDDARLTLENAIDATRRGAVVVTQAKVTGFGKDDMGRVTQATVQCQITGESKTVEAGTVINATGPWTDKTIAMSQVLQSGSLLRPTKGVHIVVDSARLGLDNAVVCLHPEDGRVLFAIPWGDRTYIGTTDTDDHADPSETRANAADVDYLIDASNAYFPTAKLTREDVFATWAGLRPLIRPVSKDGTVDESSVSREHQIIVGKDGLITIAGGKLTTYRRMAAEVIDTASKMLRLTKGLQVKASAATDREPLPGAQDWPEDDDLSRLKAQVAEVADGLISQETVELLVRSYGTRAVDVARLVRKDAHLATVLVPGRHEILAQVDWAVQEELACEVEDVMVRRTQIFFRDKDQGRAAAASVGERMAALLGWSDARRAASEAAYQHEVSLARAWRDDPDPTEDEKVARAEALPAV